MKGGERKRGERREGREGGRGEEGGWASGWKGKKISGSIVEPVW